MNACGPGFLRMELNTIEILLLHSGGERFAVLRNSDRIWSDGCAERMHEIEILVVTDLVEERIVSFGIHPIPANMRNLLLRFVEPGDATGNNAQACCIAFIGMFKEYLHADTDAKKRNLRGG